MTKLLDHNEGKCQCHNFSKRTDVAHKLLLTNVFIKLVSQ